MQNTKGNEKSEPKQGVIKIPPTNFNLRERERVSCKMEIHHLPKNNK